MSATGKSLPGKIQKVSQVDLSTSHVCGTHNKKIEAYCSTDKEVLCIDCILSDTHKTHEISSVTKATEFEKEQLTLKYRACADLEQALSD